jgi:hypothetical protein
MCRRTLNQFFHKDSSRSNDRNVTSRIIQEIKSDNISNYKRNKKENIRPVLIIQNVRRIPEVLNAYNSFTHIDRVFFRNMPPVEANKQINNWLETNSRKYTHAIITSDDLLVTSSDINQLIGDVEEYDVPVIAGCCNICSFIPNTEHGKICKFCLKKLEHPLANITFNPVNYWPLCFNSYNFSTMNYIKKMTNIDLIKRVWFQGLALACISIETWQRVKFNNWAQFHYAPTDLSFAEDCAQKSIAQFVDFRIQMKHLGTHHGRLLVGREPSSIDFIPKRG